VNTFRKVKENGELEEEIKSEQKGEERKKDELQSKVDVIQKEHSKLQPKKLDNPTQIKSAKQPQETINHDALKIHQMAQTAPKKSQRKIFEVFICFNFGTL